ncbi:hypothetical protein NUACC21_01680 [Scytonema sp. NUACC21]
MLPQGKLLITSLCIILGTYVILLGADYLDSPKIMDKAEGIAIGDGAQIINRDMRDR